MALQGLICLAVLMLGLGCLRSHPRAVELVWPIRKFLKAFLGEDYDIPDLTIGIAILALGLLALLNTFMMFAARYGFWVV